MPKEDCKYWEKCYQRNQHHLQKYNHPKKMEKSEENSEKEVSKRKSTDNETSNEDKYETEDLRAEALGNIAGKNFAEILQKRIKLSKQKEYEELLQTKDFIRHKFLVEMPEDFYTFWEFVKTLSKKDNGEDVLQYIEKEFQLLLVGPFEYLAGRFDKAAIYEPGDYLRHWRFYYDPAEFQTIFVRKDTGKHYGYWRDTPKETEGLLLARNDSGMGCEFDFIAGNVFDAFIYFLDNDFPQTPFTVGRVSNIKKSLNEYVKTNEIKLEKLDDLMKRRSNSIVTKTFHRAGIVVPVDKKTRVGYRPLIVSDAELKKILSLLEKASSDNDQEEAIKMVMEKLQPVISAATIAVDECDFGASLELGIDLFCSGHVELHSLVLSLLVPPYTLLSRPQFIAISKAHLENRNRGINLSIFDSNKT